ncbi:MULTISPECIES: hypothetical protein [Achromobacter]|uniref:Uncharacterized protein n=1 Tax=Achromobacter spanius TaxID=217203 RepID=A0ABY8GSP8_9BURK|nr:MULTISPECIES: hypothetical protein [Achromobacter]WAI82890.1 hypothetical protein N8Z00_25870 [Achromobacter spanius]WEX92976.1 hypothetical protein N3Z32_20470 [Achromobacter sp. SS2-2022]WFP07870.1 hypothetical protein P8T11_26790 [Achromobacter spanius]
MPSRHNDAGIPTLTQRAEPTLYAPRTPVESDEPETPVLTELADDAAADADDAFPLLTDIADGRGQDWDVDEAPAAVHVGAAQAATSLPDASVLSARLQAEVEQLMRRALDDAIEQIQTRMDAELPGIVSRVLNEVRPG